MEVRLVLDIDGSRKRTVRLRSEETILGRRQDCDLRIKSSEVSRRHCLLSMRDGYLSVEDLDSVNGTYLNGKRVLSKQTVRPGDYLEVGPARFIIEYEISQDALDRLDQAQGGDEDQMEELPLARGDAGIASFALSSADELEALPLAGDEDTEQVLPQPADSADEALPVLEEIEEGGDWHLPQSGDLRDILADMDDPKSKQRPSGK